LTLQFAAATLWYTADDPDDYFDGDFLQDILEGQLLKLGGHDLWHDARANPIQSPGDPLMLLLVSSSESRAPWSPTS
jgi:hypothetical protein